MSSWTLVGEVKALIPGLAAAASVAVPVFTTLLYTDQHGEDSDEVDMFEVARLLASGAIDDDTLVWSDGMPSWVKFGESRSVFAGLAAAIEELGEAGEKPGSSPGSSPPPPQQAAPVDQSQAIAQKKACYAALVQRILSGQASERDTAESERLAAELEQLGRSAGGGLDKTAQATVIAALEKLPLMEELSPEHRKAIAASCELITFDEGDLIFDEGDAGDYFYIIEKGTVSIVRNRGLPTQIELVQLHSGAYFGELALLNNEKRAGAAVVIKSAKGEGCECLRVKRVDFDRALGAMMSIIKAGMNERRKETSAQKPPTLVAAVVNTDVVAVRSMLTAEAASKINVAVEAVESPGLSLLHLAVLAGGGLDVVQALVGAKANVNVCSPDGCTPLHLCARDGRRAMAAFLIEHGAQIEATTLGGATPLHIAAQEGQLAVLKLLVEKGAVLKMGSLAGLFPLHMAAGAGQFDVVSFLLAGNRAAVNQPDESGRQATALHYASAAGSSAVVWRLLQRGASPESEMAGSITPLFLAAQNGHTHVVDQLLGVMGKSSNLKIVLFPVF